MYQTDNCNIMVDWIEPVDNGARVTAYKIEIQNSRSTWDAWTGRCEGTDCLIPMELLGVGSLWNLAQNSRIAVRVLATNVYGWSEPGSAVSSGIRMGGVPQRMERPYATVTYPNIEVCWDTI
jgi:hypothetical protein